MKRFTIRRFHPGLMSSPQKMPSRVPNAAPDKGRNPGPFFYQFLDSLPVFLAAFDGKGRFVFWNREAERVSGYAADRACKEPLPGPDAFESGIRMPLRNLLDHWGTGRVYMELAIITRTGRRKDLLALDVSRSRSVPGWHAWVLAVDIGKVLAEDVKLTQALAKIRRILTQLSLPPPEAYPEAAGSRLGELGLTRKEQEVVRLLADGQSNKEIAAVLRVSESTVKVHAYSIYRKLHVKNRVELIRFIVRNEIPL